MLQDPWTALRLTLTGSSEHKRSISVEAFTPFKKAPDHYFGRGTSSVRIGEVE